MVEQTVRRVEGRATLERRPSIVLGEPVSLLGYAFTPR